MFKNIFGKISELLDRDRENKPMVFFYRYGFALLNCLVAIVLTRWSIPVIKSDAFDFFQGAVALSAWYGGLGPGLLAAGVSLIALDYHFIPPFNHFSYTKTDLLRLTIFGAVALLTSSLSAKLKEAKAFLEKAQEDLEIRIAQRTQELSDANHKLVQEIHQRHEAEKAIMEISHREQTRLGQDLHDGLSQILAGVKLMTERVKQELVKKQIPESERVAVIESRLGEALSYVDTVSRGLYPVELETNGLMAALKELSVKFSHVYSVDCRFKCARPVVLSESAIANHVYRIAHEAMINAIKGGKASRINIRLSHSEDHILLTVADNGTGIGSAPLRKGMGLKIMEYRAKVMNGFLEFRSLPKHGTLMKFLFPIHIHQGIPQKEA